MYFGGNQLANYSIVSLEEIGERESALICHTNSPGCCESPRAGEWYFPNGSVVSIEEDMNDFYRNKSCRAVLLHRKHNAMGPTGIYCCDIPGSINGNLCVGAYNLREGKNIRRQNHCCMTL